ncbi:MAG: PASTA domain-containing protein [Ruminococcaceae bacterium]|nr:PASTA domain-containing protein [Oscillospiraceae bacterium]
MSKLCMNCMTELDESIGGGAICPKCAFDNTTEQTKYALAYETFLGDRYITGKVKSANSEGFTYIAYDTETGKNVSIREFCPVTLTYRNTNNMAIAPAEGNRGIFSDLLKEFCNLYIKLMKASSINGIVTVTDIFYENGTAYAVMKYEDGVTLRSYKEQNSAERNAVINMFIPLISSLSTMHSLGIKHLGISPDTLKVTSEGKLVLTEFSIESVRKVSGPLEAVLYEGFAAPEQYSENSDCDELTDIYATCASLLFALTGTTPANAQKRLKDDKLLVSREKIRHIPQNALSVIAQGLRVSRSERVASFERLRVELTGNVKLKDSLDEMKITKSLPKRDTGTRRHFSLPPKFWAVTAFALTLCAIIGYFYYLTNYTDFSMKEFAEDILPESQTEITEVITAPKLEGANYHDWLEKMKDASLYRFSIKVVSMEFSEEVEKDYIISQSPAPGETMSKNGVIELIVSRGSRMIELPKVNGQKFISVAEELEALGFTVVRIDSYSKDIAADYVIWYKDHYSGDLVEYGSEIEVYVSIGPNE